MKEVPEDEGSTSHVSKWEEWGATLPTKVAVWCEHDTVVFESH